MAEERVGKITHYYTHLGVAAVDLSAPLKVGDTIHVKGHSSDFTQKVESIQIEHGGVEEAGAGVSVGIKLKEHGREHDEVYKVTED